MMPARVLRWAGVALALAAIVDPTVSIPRRERPPVRVLDGGDVAARQRLVDQLSSAGFPLASDGEAVSIASADTPIAPALPATPLYVLRETVDVADVSILRATVSGPRVADQAIGVAVTVHARGAGGSTTTVRLEDGGLTVASAVHQWSNREETWQTTLRYLPDGSRERRLRVRADALAGERRTADNVVDVLVPAMRGPVRALVIESAVTWPAVFVRRALEASPAYSVAAIQRATPAVATRAGSPPRGMTRDDLAPYEVVLVGQPESIDGAGFDALRWFVEERGGVAVFVPDRAPDARSASLAGGVAFDAKTLEAPVALGGIGAGLMSAELARPRALPPLAFPLAADPEGAPVVFGLRRGLGAVIVSGALDAWRYRDRNDGAFARFWRAAILQQAQTVPPIVEVTAVPSLARPGDLVRVSVRLRETALSVGDRINVPEAAARVVNADGHGETIVRLWPASAPGVYEGEWRPATTGDYAVDATVGGGNGAALVKVVSDVVMPASDPAAVEIAARATGGGVLEEESALIRALSDRFPSRTVTRPSHPARSPWYAAVFALLLCGEWAIRRRRGFA